MSLVGTRPPTLDEWDKYELHHRARLAIKPGIANYAQTECQFRYCGTAIPFLTVRSTAR